MPRSSPPTAAAWAAPSCRAGAPAAVAAAAGGSAPRAPTLATGLRERDAGSLLRAPVALLGERRVARLRARLVARRLGSTSWLEPYRRPEGTPASSAPTA